MKVLFLNDLRPTARAGDIKDVKNGFARNFLIPNNIAVVATEQELKRATKLREEAAQRRSLEQKDWERISEEIQKKSIDIEVKTGPTGRLYGSVNNTIIASKLNEITKREDIDRKTIHISSPIRTTGSYKVKVNLFENVSTEINVNVVPDEESKQLNKQMEEVSKLITKEENVLDPSFEDVLAAAEENIQSSNIDDSENASEKTNQEVEESKETQE
ncbi:MAG: 50S ribosomal protein L9 [Dehalococcoidia bacterium]|nr:50S ribosomal protein L9 [Dehalococcoidia bacterium]MQG09104.1 50S ribosomal protein L9 [SAR202 cluster bacterium]|tara:strand:+ start:10661 stop:11308 length:648 start_codon:yes stop_codon:yes gene_type:complete